VKEFSGAPVMVQLEAEPFIAISLLLRGFFIMNSCAEGTEIQGSQVVLRHTTLSQSLKLNLRKHIHTKITSF